MTVTINYFLLRSTRSTSCLGQEFRRGAIVCTKRPSDHDYLDFGEVLHILVHEEAEYVVLKKFETITFSHHYFAYEIEPLEDFVALCDLAFHQVFYKYCVASNFFMWLSNPVTMLNYSYRLVLSNLLYCF